MIHMIVSNDTTVNEANRVPPLPDSPEQLFNARVRAKGTYEGGADPVRAKEFAGDLAQFGRADFVDAAFDFFGGDDLPVTEEVFAEPHHLVVGTFERDLHLADEIIARLPQFFGS